MMNKRLESRIHKEPLKVSMINKTQQENGQKDDRHLMEGESQIANK